MIIISNLINLRLLFRHFSQRQEVLRSFGQVQLLVSDCDVKSYKQIKDDLDDLRLLVEKSELCCVWMVWGRGENNALHWPVCGGVTQAKTGETST